MNAFRHLTRKPVLMLGIAGLFISLLVLLFGLYWFFLRVPGLPADVSVNISRIYLDGRMKGNRPDVFSKVGDSITVSRQFLQPFGTGDYDLGSYGYLQAAIDHFSQTTARSSSSFDNLSLAAGVGWSASAVLNPDFADPALCQPGESPLACEYRHTRPALAIIMFGTNDAGYRTVEQYRADMAAIVSQSIDMGVIPILSTIPPRPDVSQQVQAFNQVVRELAQSQRIPLIELADSLAGLPDGGLSWDAVHPSAPPDGRSGDLREANFAYGYVVRNFQTLDMLNRVRSALN